MVEHLSVVTRPDLLHENYFPADITEREMQIREISLCLEPALRKTKPMHVWLYGESGTGKTLAAKHMLRKFQNGAYADGIYVNCWEYNSYYSVLDKLVRDLRILGAEKLNTSFKLERFQQFIGKKPFIIILDDIDQFKHTETGNLIFNLCTYGNIGLVCISKSRLTLYSLDNRIFSRLNARQVAFTPYTCEELYRILSRRAVFCIRSGTCSDALLHHVAKLAEGNARIAFQTLRNAAYIAEKERSPNIKLGHIKEGNNSSRELEKSYLLNRLNSHHKILYELVKEKKEINSGDLWNAYLEKCEELQKHPIAVRTFSEYMNKMIEMELVHWDRALVRGKVRVFFV